MAWYAHYGVQIYRVRNWNIRGWCAPSIARGIPRPAVSKYTGLGGGPTWKDVRQLLQSTRGSTPVTLHARAILSLCSIYALKEIAAFLGHRDPRSIGIYAKHDTRSLREAGRRCALASITARQVSAFLSGPRTSTVTWRYKYHQLKNFFEFLGSTG